jgi:hypothetical protein
MHCRDIMIPQRNSNQQGNGSAKCKRCFRSADICTNKPPMPEIILVPAKYISGKSDATIPD